jgi:hypothetical protein
MHPKEHRMDYRHTEDFARRMETAELRAHALRREASQAFWSAVAARLQRTFAGLRRPGAHVRGDRALPEA